MRLATFVEGDDTQPRTGVLSEAGIHPFDQGLTMRDLIALGREALDFRAQEALSGTAVPLDRVRLLAPLQPASVRDFVVFEEHVEGVRRSIDRAHGVAEAWYDAPTFYFTNPHAIIGPGDPVAFPAACRDRDFELEVAVVVGRAGTSFPVDQAGEHVFGYTIMNDWSARDLQGREMQVGLGPAKGKDFATTLGPVLVTADELEPHKDADGFLQLWCSVSVNGEEVGRDLLSNMGWTFEAMLAYAARDSVVKPGDVLGSGTLGNGGCLAELWGRRGEQNPPPLQPGDVVTLEVEALGTLTNTVAVAGPAPVLPAPRRRDAARARADAASGQEERA